MDTVVKEMVQSRSLAEVLGVVRSCLDALEGSTSTEESHVSQLMGAATDRRPSEAASSSISKLSVCRQIIDVAPHLLQQGVAVYLGPCGHRNTSVVAVYCKQSLWQRSPFSSEDLARLLLYYCSIQRRDEGGVVLVADAREAGPDAINTLLEALYTVEASCPGSLAVVHVVADRQARSLIFRSSVFQPQVRLKIDLLMGIEALFRIADLKRLPWELGGHSHHDHGAWIRQRAKLEAFLNRCRHSCSVLLSLIQELIMTFNDLPSNADQLHSLLDRRKQMAVQADLQLGPEERLLDEMLDAVQRPNATEDFREGVTVAEKLFQEVQDARDRLLRVSHNQQEHLHSCIQLQQLCAAAKEVLRWIESDGDQFLRKHATLADNLKDILHQQKDFNSFYQEAMAYTSKGDTLIKEISKAATDVKDESAVTIATELKPAVDDFASSMDTLKERVDLAAKCYTLLDQSYEWALEAMKHAVSLRSDGCLSVDELDGLLTSLSEYLEAHPPIADEIFEEMQSIASRLGNEKLSGQCSIAKSRCAETLHLLRVRHTTLRKAREQMGLERNRASPVVRNSFCASNERSRTENLSDDTVVLRRRDSVRGAQWDNLAHSPIDNLLSVLRRRSYAGKPSTPMYSPMAAAFKENSRDMNLSEYEEYLFSEGLITEDMSDRIVAFLPKGLSDSTLKGSRESVRSSVDNIPGIKLDDTSLDNTSCGSKSPMPTNLCAAPEGFPQTSSSMSLSPSASFLDNSELALRLGCSFQRPSTMRKSHSLVAPSSQHADNRWRNLSMMTSSTESLPCMPEEELDSLDYEVPLSEPSTPCTQSWSPVPMNPSISRATPLSSTFQSMSDLRYHEQDIRRRKNLALITREMIQTEGDYIRSLRLVIDNYLPEMTKESVPHNLRGKRNIIFGNIEKIYYFHSQVFQEELQNCESNPFTAGRIFMEHAPEFYLYALYNKNKPKCDAILAESGKAFFQAKQLELQDKLDLASYLLKPVQRMAKYALLLKQLLQLCPEHVPEYSDLKAAVEMVKFQLRHGNDLLAMDCLRDCDVNLAEQGMLLRQQDFLVWQGRRKCVRRLFLFEELLVLSKAKLLPSGEEVYQYKSSIKTSELGLTENVGDSGAKFEVWFRKRMSGGTYTMQAPSLEIKRQWVTEMSRLLWKQAIRNRELKKVENHQMGMGGKPGLDLKPSKDNISDRLVSVSLANRVSSLSMCRNSIAVPDTHTQRPHSLISLSSNSSMSSGYQSMHSSGSPHNPSTSTPLKPLGHLSPGSPESGVNSCKSPLSPVSPLTEDAFTQTTMKNRKQDQESSSVLSLTQIEDEGVVCCNSDV